MIRIFVFNDLSLNSYKRITRLQWTHIDYSHWLIITVVSWRQIESTTIRMRSTFGYLDISLFECKLKFTVIFFIELWLRFCFSFLSYILSIYSVQLVVELISCEGLFDSVSAGIPGLQMQNKIKQEFSL